MRAANRLANAMRQQAALSSLDVSKPRTGTITSYDPNKHAVKVTIQPEGVDAAGWIPLGAVGVGNGFGVLCAPNIGDMVMVEFAEGNSRAPRIVGRFFSTVDVPPSVPSGETWIVHQSGSFLKFHNDGSIEVKASAGATYAATSHTFTGPVTMNQTVLVKQQITGQGGMAVSGGSGASVSGNITVTGGDVKADGIGLKSHTHVDPQGGTVGAAQG
jgi:phage baseplate assembly protein V